MEIENKFIINHNVPKKINKNILEIFSSLNNYIKENLDNLKLIEKKLLLINNYIKETLSDKLNKETQTLSNFSPSQKISRRIVSATIKPKLYRLNFKEEGKDLYKNRTISGTGNGPNNGFGEELNTNEIIIMKLKKKLKQENEKHKLRELEYLERIAHIQYKVDLYESNIKKYIIVNTNKQKLKKKTKSCELLKNTNSTNYTNGEYEPNENKILHNKKIVFKPSKYFMNPSNLKSNIYHRNLIDQTNEYFTGPKLSKAFGHGYGQGLDLAPSSTNVNCIKNKRSFSSLNELNYKYQTGNLYYKKDFEQIKKAANENLDKIEMLKISHNLFVNHLKDKTDKEYKKMVKHQT